MSSGIPACYWIQSNGISLGFIPEPSTESHEGKAKEPGTSRITIDGHPVVQTDDQTGCYQYVALTPSNSFSTMALRNEAKAPHNTCEINSGFTNLVIAHLVVSQQQHSTDDPT